MKHKFVTKLFLIATLVLGTSATIVTSYASSNNFNEKQTQEIQQIVHDYLINNPQILVEAAKELRSKSLAKMKHDLKNMVLKYKDEVFTTKRRPVLGNHHGTLTMVEFFDNQCIACKGTAPAVEKLIKNNPSLKVVFVDWPFFGRNSVYAAKVAFAAFAHNKYAEVHHLFMQEPISSKGEANTLTHDKVMELVAKAGLDKDKIAEIVKANNDEYDKTLKNNFALAQKLGLNGTPAFFFLNKDNGKVGVFPGGGNEADLQKALDAVK